MINKYNKSGNKRFNKKGQKSARHDHGLALNQKHLRHFSRLTGAIKQCNGFFDKRPQQRHGDGLQVISTQTGKELADAKRVNWRMNGAQISGQAN